MTTATTTEWAARRHRRAINYFWAWLAGATLASLVGKVAHALLTAPAGSRWLAAGVAAVPPVALLASVHAVAVLVRADASGQVYRASVGATAALGAGAFALSFVALRDLAVLAGTPPALAWLLPLVIDTAVAVATSRDRRAGGGRRTTSGTWRSAGWCPQPAPRALPPPR